MTTPRIQTVGAASCRPHPAPRYDVFLSYRHAPADTAAAVKAMAFLESYRPPEFQDARVAQPRRVFRDTEELPVSSALSAAIEEALREARSLLVVCSERTPESAWVDREVRTF
ncbi:MAG: toll/interleukin-1 receptor domain-containing protein, partial [Clostridiales Family XIII bacterium]|nr:toll/interleukin-1 receptor domain-containing protein [Clostridiales Family XIII bacterium]